MASTAPSSAYRCASSCSRAAAWFWKRSLRHSQKPGDTEDTEKAPVSSVLVGGGFCARREDLGARGGAHAQFSPALGVARARGIGRDVKCGRGGGRHRNRADRASDANLAVVSAASAAGKFGRPSYPALALRRARGWIVERAFARIGECRRYVGLRAKPALCLCG